MSADVDAVRSIAGIREDPAPATRVYPDGLHPHGYPAGAFLVASSQHIDPLVQRLRQASRLKHGRNVTPFDGWRFASLPAASPLTEAVACSSAAASPRLSIHSLQVWQTSVDEEKEYHRPCASGPCSDAAPLYHEARSEDFLCGETHEMMTTAANAYTATQPSERLLEWLQCPRSERSGTVGGEELFAHFYAIHVVGEWTIDQLASFLCPATKEAEESASGLSPSAPLAIAFIRGLRCYSRVCCPNLKGLPTPLHAMRAAALSYRRSTVPSAAPAPPTKPPVFTFSELFGGIGMFRSGLEMIAGVHWREVVVVEYAPAAQQVYAINHPCTYGFPATCGLTGPLVPSPADMGECPNTEKTAGDSSHMSPPLVGDITEIPTPFFVAHDLLTGGFPCQSFAKAGPATGLRAASGWLFYEVVRVLAGARPRTFLLENVENLVAVEEGAQLAEVLRRLRCPSTGVRYNVGWRVVDGGLLTPQTRRRVYFIGVRVAAETQAEEVEESLVDSIFAAAQEILNSRATVSNRRYRCVQDVLEDPMPPSDLDELRLTAGQWEAVRSSRSYRHNPLWRVSDVRHTARTLLGSYRSSYQLYSEFVPCPSHLSLAEVERQLCFHSPSSPRASESLPEHSEGSIAGDLVENAMPSRPPLRFYSIRECARLQGIADTFRFPHDRTAASFLPASTLRTVERHIPRGTVYKLIGNAVNPQIVACFGSAITAYLDQKDRLAKYPVEGVRSGGSV